MKKLIKILIFVSLFLIINITVSASVELNENVFYDGFKGASYIFAQVDSEYDECGITVNNEFYPARFVTSQGKFGISLVDITAKLGSSYEAKAYTKLNGEYIYSENSISVDTKIIFATPETVSEKITELSPGNTLLLEDGIYNELKLTINDSGTEQKPIIIRSRNKGKAEFRGESQIHINGSYVTVADILFNECLYDDIYENSNVIAFSNCTKSRVTGCAFITCGHTATATSSLFSFKTGAVECRADNNLFKDTRALSITLSSSNLSNNGNAPINNRIDHNYFLDIKRAKDLFPKGDGNGFECIQLMYGDINTQMGTIVEYNRFENVIGDGGEIISNKSSGNIYRYNTFVNCASGPTLRSGNNCVFDNNFMINIDGTRIFGTGHSIKNNYFYRSGSFNLDTAYDNINDEGYVPQSDADIAGNLFVESGGNQAILIGKFFDTINMRNLLPTNVKITDNYFYLKNSRAIFNYTTNPEITYSGNKAVFTGESSFGVSEGFAEVNDELYFDGDIYYPKNKAPDKKGLILLKDKTDWWLSYVTTGTDNFSVTEPINKTITAYAPSVTSMGLKNGYEFNAGYLAGTATYEDGTTYKPSVKEIIFAENSNYCEIVDGKIKLINTTGNAQSVTITSTYKGISSKTTITVYPDCYFNSQTGDYYDYNTAIPIYKNGGATNDFASSNGAIYSANDSPKKAGAGTILSNLFIPEGDFELTMDVTVKKPTENTPKVHILLGLREYFNPHSISVDLYNGGGIQSYQNYALLGECWGEGLKLNTKQNVRIVKRGNILTASIDGKIATIAELATSLEGKVSFRTEYADLRVENINLYKKTYKDEDVLNIPLSVERVDENMIRIKTTSINDSYIYRFIKNGQYKGIGDSGCDYVEGSVKLNVDYLYEVYAYDINGVLRGKGEIDVKLLPSGNNDFFKISNILVRAGVGGSYVSSYDRQNRFLKVGSKAHSDRDWKFTYVAPQFIDSAILLTGNNDRTNSQLVTYRDNWLTFDINRSATVYVITYLTTKYLPWLSAENGWTQEDNYIYQVDEEGNRVKDENGKDILLGYKYFNISDCSNNYVYSKHFDTPDGVNLNIKLGGSTNQMSSIYTVVVKPDVLPEPVEILRKY